MLRDTKKYSTALVEAQASESLSHFFADQPSAYTERWRKALEDERCVAVLQVLFAHSACSPTFALTARQIGRLTGLHHQVVRRLIRGDKYCKARLQGLVAWLAGKGRRGTRYWLSPEGAKVAELLAKGLPLGEATLKALATDRFRRRMAHSTQMAQENGTGSKRYMPYGFCNVCRRAVASKLSRPIERSEPLSPLAEKLHCEFRIVAWVANDIVQRHSPEAIEAAIALCERRNGQVFNKAGFVIYLLREGFAQAYAEACRRKAQEWDEPDFSVEALRAALAPYGISVDDDGYAVFANGRLALPPDPAEAIALLRKLGLLRPEALPADHDASELSESTSVSDQPTQPDSDLESEWTDELTSEPDLADRAASELSESVSVSDQPTHDPTYSTPNLAAEVSELMDAPADSELIDEPTDEPLPEPTCVVCQRCQGDHHPALVKAQPMMPLPRLSDGFRRRFNLPEEGYICRGCYLSFCKQLTAETQGSNGSDEDKSEATDLPDGTCPRCGTNGDLQVFNPQPFAQPFVAADPELARWNGKALCEPCRCYLRVREGKVWLSNEAERTADHAGGNLTTVADFVDTEVWLAEAFR